jgi:cyclopropane fatty-acyl-phospholipid synthase-like methyltransferase
MFESVGFVKIPDHIIQEYKNFDPEAGLFFADFDEPKGSKILEIGSQHSPLASMMAKCGFHVTGIDLRDSDQELNYNHITADFCRLPSYFIRENIGTFDAAVIVSAIEHFGLNTYGEGRKHEYYDVIAMRYIYDLLKPGGTCYLTTPFGGKFVEHKPHWRVYDWANLLERIVQDFSTEVFNLGVCEEITINGKVFSVGSPISMNEAILNTIGLPHVSCYVRLRKPLD